MLKIKMGQMKEIVNKEKDEISKNLKSTLSYEK